MFTLLSHDRRQDLITALTCTTEHANISALTLDIVFSREHSMHGGPTLQPQKQIGALRLPAFFKPKQPLNPNLPSVSTHWNLAAAQMILVLRGQTFIVFGLHFSTTAQTTWVQETGKRALTLVRPVPSLPCWQPTHLRAVMKIKAGFLFLSSCNYPVVQWTGG